MPDDSRGLNASGSVSARTYLRVYLACIRNCLVRELEFRGHFFMLCLSNCIWGVVGLLFAAILFGNIRTVAGWDLDRMILLTGTFQIVVSTSNFLFNRNMTSLAEQVNRGDLDFVLMKPLSSQFLVSARYVTFSELPGILVGVVYVTSAVGRLALALTPLQIVGFVVLLVAGVLSSYAVWFMSVTLALWSGRINNIAFLPLPIMDLARVPTDIYSGLARFVLTFVLPIAFVATVPSKALLGELDLGLWLYAGVFTIFLLCASNRFWHFSLRRYSSASS